MLCKYSALLFLTFSQGFCKDFVLVKDKADHYYQNSDGNLPTSWQLEPLPREDLQSRQDPGGNIKEVHRVFPDDDPFVILPANLKNFEKLGADLFFNLLVKISLYSILISMLIPAVVPMWNILISLANIAIILVS